MWYPGEGKYEMSRFANQNRNQTHAQTEKRVIAPVTTTTALMHRKSPKNVAQSEEKKIKKGKNSETHHLACFPDSSPKFVPLCAHIFSLAGRK